MYIYLLQSKPTNIQEKEHKRSLEINFLWDGKEKKGVERQKTAQKLKKGAKKKIVGALNNKKS